MIANKLLSPKPGCLVHPFLPYNSFKLLQNAPFYVTLIVWVGLVDRHHMVDSQRFTQHKMSVNKLLVSSHDIACLM